MDNTGAIQWQISLWAIINGQEIPVSTASMSYALNTIPDCTLVLPLGREFNALAASPVHKLADDLKHSEKCEVFMELKMIGSVGEIGDILANLGIPEGPFKIFSGSTAGGGFSKQRGRATYTLNVVHWLSEMSHSSIFSKSSHVTNGDYSYGALMESDETGARDWTDLTQASDYIDELDGDLWADCLYPWLEHICDEDVFWIREQDVRGSGKNDGALEALKRIRRDGDCYYPLKFAESPDQDVKEVIGQYISDGSRDPGNLAHHTLWDLLVGRFSNDFLFSLVPRVDDALISPFVPGYREVLQTLGPDEYNHIEWSMAMQHPIRAVGVLSQLGVGSGADMPPGGRTPATKLGVGGFYAGGEEGMVMVKQGPAWCGSLMATNLPSDESSGGDGELVDDAIDPGEAPKKNNVRDEAKERGGEVIKPFLDKYAQTLYALEMIKSRQLVISGPLRFDIAPGSSLRLLGSPEQYMEDDSLGKPLYGQVLRISLMIDAEGQSAGCGIHMGYVRREAENDSDNTSVERHPLYDDTFVGCSLVEV